MAAVLERRCPDGGGGPLPSNACPPDFQPAALQSLEGKSAMNELAVHNKPYMLGKAAHRHDSTCLSSKASHALGRIQPACKHCWRRTQCSPPIKLETQARGGGRRKRRQGMRHETKALRNGVSEARSRRPRLRGSQREARPQGLLGPRAPRPCSGQSRRARAGPLLPRLRGCRPPRGRPSRWQRTP